MAYSSEQTVVFVGVDVIFSLLYGIVRTLRDRISFFFFFFLKTKKEKRTIIVFDVTGGLNF